MVIITSKKFSGPKPVNQYYETPMPLAKAMVRKALFRMYPGIIGDQLVLERVRILDPGAGKGSFGRAIRFFLPNAHLVGVESNPEFTAPSWYSQWFSTTLQDLHQNQREVLSGFDLVIGNPPYKEAEEFIRIGHAACRLSGSVLFLAKLNLLEGQKRSAGLWETLPPDKVSVLARRPSFNNSGHTQDFAFALYHWIKRGYRLGEESPILEWFDWNPKEE